MYAKPDTYKQAQRAIADLKGAILSLLDDASPKGLRNVEIGRSLGIYAGHSGQHDGHIPRTLLDMMESEGIVKQDKETRRWHLQNHGRNADGTV
jgi:DNA-binding IclR family transcriptional regulator